MYSLFLNNETYIEEKSKYDFVYLASITKFVVMLGFLHCIRSHHLRVTSKVKKVFPEFEHDYTFQDIINHRTALANDWLGSQLNKRYSKSNNIYEFSLHLPTTSEPVNNFKYNNYAYDILAYTVFTLEGVFIDKYLEHTLLRGVKYKWYGHGKQVFGGHGLCIHTSTGVTFAQNVAQSIQNNNLAFFWDQTDVVMNKKKVHLVGHDGSGGQYMYYCPSTKSIFCWFTYSFKDEAHRPIETYYKMFAERDAAVSRR